MFLLLWKLNKQLKRKPESNDIRQRSKLKSTNLLTSQDYLIPFDLLSVENTASFVRYRYVFVARKTIWKNSKEQSGRVFLLTPAFSYGGERRGRGDNKNFLEQFATTFHADSSNGNLIDREFLVRRSTANWQSATKWSKFDTVLCIIKELGGKFASTGCSTAVVICNNSPVVYFR